MKQQLFHPFRFSQWIRFAIVGFLAGEMGFSGRGPINFSSEREQLPSVFPPAGPLLVLAIALLVVLGLVVGMILLYISSRMRFVLFDGIVNGECRIRESWGRRGEPAFRYFIWQIGLVLLSLAGLALFIGIPLLVAYRAGVFQNPLDHLGLLIIAGLVLLLFGFVWFLIVALATVLTKDFVVPQMAFEDLTVTEGWRRLWPMMMAEKGPYAGYIGMKIVLAIGAVLVLGIISLILFLVLLIPVGGFGFVAVLLGRAAGLRWNPLTIALAIVLGLIALVALILMLALISVPAIVFFPAYSLYFFADRYPPLGNVFNPPPLESVP